MSAYTANRTHGGIARALLESRHAWNDDELRFLRCMVGAPVASREDFSRLIDMTDAAAKDDVASPRYEAGWMILGLEGGGVRYEAFLRPVSEDWYDLHPCPTWWTALAKAMAIASATPDCEFIGGPDETGAVS